METLRQSDSDRYDASEYCDKKKWPFAVTMITAGFFAFCFIVSLLSSDPQAEKILHASVFLLFFVVTLMGCFIWFSHSLALLEDGVSIGKWFRVKKVTWDDIKSVEIYSNMEVILRLSGTKKVTINLGLFSCPDSVIECLKTKIPASNIIALPRREIMLSIKYPHYISMCSMLLMMVLMFLPGRNIILAGLLYGNILGVCFFYCARWVLSHWESFNQESSPVSKRIKYFLFAKIINLL